MIRNERMTPFLQFDFKTIKSDLKACFFNPLKIIQTNDYEDVITCLQEVEDAISQGYYAAGFVSYEAVYGLVKNGMQKENNVPLVWFGIFSNIHDAPRWDKNAYHVSEWTVGETKDDYAHAFQQIMNEINAKKVEQVNYTVQFHADFAGDVYAYYEDLKKAQQSNYCAFLDLGEIAILSLSPELFFHYHEDKLTVKPMKGTIHRGLTNEMDEKNRTWLQSSEKNQRENDLITELMKKELEKITEQKEINIVERYEIETYPTVFQMTSTIQANVSEQQSIVDLFTKLFPCGSITGVPKMRAIELIHELEKLPRDVYCGAIGYVTPEKTAIFNVGIRTLTIHQREQHASYGAGGAITIESKLEEEYEEMLTKTKVLHHFTPTFQLLETIGLQDGKWILLQEHFERLQHSARYFNYPLQLERLKAKLKDVQTNYRYGHWRVRVTIDADGDEHLEVYKLQETTNRRIRVADTPIDVNNRFLYHKTTYRTMYEAHHDSSGAYFDTLLWNKYGEVTEFTIGNLVYELDGKLYTPPVECGLLPGTFRKRLLEEKKIKERKLSIEELLICSALWFINSVRGWIPVQLDTSSLPKQDFRKK